MKSQILKKKNLPIKDLPLTSIKVKPQELLYCFMAVGCFCLFYPSVNALGICFIIFALLGISIFPERTLVEIFSDFMVLYNQADPYICWIIYWNEVNSWVYEKRKTYDVLKVSLLDGTTVTIDLYSKQSIEPYLLEYTKKDEGKI